MKKRFGRFLFISLLAFSLVQMSSAQEKSKEPTPEVEKLANAALDPSASWDVRLQRAQAALAAAEKSNDYVGKGIALSIEGQAYVMLKRYQEAIPALKQALAISTDLQIPEGQIPSLTNLVQATFSVGLLGDTEKYGQQVLPLLRMEKDDDDELAVLITLASAYKQEGKTKEYSAVISDLIALRRKGGSKKDLAGFLVVEGQLQLELRNFPRAAESFEEAITYYRSQSDWVQLVTCLNDLSIAYASQASGFDKAVLTNKESISRSLEHHLSALYATAQIDKLLIYRLNGQPRKGLQVAANFKKDKAFKPTAAHSCLVETTISELFVDIGDLTHASSHAKLSYKFAELANDSLSKGLAQFSLGLVDAGNGKATKAVADFQNSLPLLDKSGLRSLSMLARINLGQAENQVGLRTEAIKDLSQTLDYFLPGGDPDTLGTVLNAFGLLFRNLGSYQTAGDCFAKALDYLKTNRGGQDVLARQNLGMTLCDLDEPDQALKQLNQALKDEAKLNLKPLTGTTENNIGLVYNQKGDAKNAILHFENALPLLHDSNLRTYGVVLNNLAVARLSQDVKYDPSREFEEALEIARSTGDDLQETLTLTNLASSYSSKGQLLLALPFAKLAVRKTEESRLAISALEPGIQNDFKNSVLFRYRLLAQIFAELGKLPEAEQTLALLKDQEFYRYLRQRTGSSFSAIDLSAMDASFVSRYEALGGKIVANITERNDLLKIDPAQRTEAQRQRLSLLRRQADSAAAAFDSFITEAEKSFKAKNIAPSRIDDLRGAQALQTVLNQLPNHPAAIYTFITSDNVRIILSIPGLNITREATKKVHFSDLSHKVLQFRLALKDPQYDPRPLGAELYDLLVRPIEKDLEASGTQQLMWSLDGPLRYIPIWALYDDQAKKYLIEKYPSSLFTPHTVDRLVQNPKSWTGVEFGVTKDETVGQTSFGALPDVEEELTGVHDSLGGEAPILDDKFTYDAFRDELDKGPHVVHIATHFNFKPSDDEGSFLLLGKGDTLSLDKLKKMEDGAFSSVDLLVLSACETAVSENADGSEFESFALLAQLKGASAVLATLWPVADESTSILMKEFYLARKEHPEWTKLQALRSVQLRMLSGEIIGKSSSSRTGESTKPSGAIDAPLWPKGQPAFAHPYYWAPFVLTGNWK